jgi:hypothetical protein
VTIGDHGVKPAFVAAQRIGAFAPPTTTSSASEMLM